MAARQSDGAQAKNETSIIPKKKKETPFTKWLSDSFNLYAVGGAERAYITLILAIHTIGTQTATGCHQELFDGEVATIVGSGSRKRLSEHLLWMSVPPKIVRRGVFDPFFTLVDPNSAYPTPWLGNKWDFSSARSFPAAPTTADITVRDAHWHKKYQCKLFFSPSAA